MADGRRGYIAKEVLSSERVFVKQLRAIVEVFLHPLRESDKPIIKQRYIEIIFSNVEEVLAVNQKLLDLFEKRLEVWNENPCLGDVFLEVLPEFDVYDKYLMEHHKTIFTVTELSSKSQWSLFLQNAKENPQCEGLELLALLMPVQRILRYKLLLEDLIRSTDKESSDYEPLTQALEKVLEKAAAVNESIKKTTNYEKLCQIQKSFITGSVKDLVTENRMFVREGSLTKICRKLPKKRMINLSKVRVKSIEDTMEQKNAFQISSNDKSFIVLADTPEEKEFWLMDFNEHTTGSRLVEETEALNVSTIDSAPVWIPDKHAVMCMLCKCPFTFIKRRHHCRNCGKVVCGPCSSGKLALPHLEERKPVRVCDMCLRTSDGDKPPDLLLPPPAISLNLSNGALPNGPPGALPDEPTPTRQSTSPQIIARMLNKTSIVSQSTPVLPTQAGAKLAPGSDKVPKGENDEVTLPSRASSKSPALNSVSTYTTSSPQQKSRATMQPSSSMSSLSSTSAPTSSPQQRMSLLPSLSQAQLLEQRKTLASRPQRPIPPKPTETEQSSASDISSESEGKSDPTGIAAVIKSLYGIDLPSEKPAVPPKRKTMNPQTSANSPIPSHPRPTPAPLSSSTSPTSNGPTSNPVNDNAQLNNQATIHQNGLNTETDPALPPLPTRPPNHPLSNSGSSLKIERMALRSEPPSRPVPVPDLPSRPLPEPSKSSLNISGSSLKIDRSPPKSEPLAKSAPADRPLPEPHKTEPSDAPPAKPNLRASGIIPSHPKPAGPKADPEVLLNKERKARAQLESEQNVLLFGSRSKRAKGTRILSKKLEEEILANAAKLMNGEFDAPPPPPLVFPPPLQQSSAVGGLGLNKKEPSFTLPPSRPPPLAPPSSQF